MKTFCLQGKKFYAFKDEYIYWETFTIDEMKEFALKPGFDVLSCQRGKLYREEEGTIIYCVCRK